MAYPVPMGFLRDYSSFMGFLRDFKYIEKNFSKGSLPRMASPRAGDRSCTNDLPGIPDISGIGVKTDIRDIGRVRAHVGYLLSWDVDTQRAKRYRTGARFPHNPGRRGETGRSRTAKVQVRMGASRKDTGP